MDFVVYDVIISKVRGIIVSINGGKDKIPKGGETYSCGDASYVVQSLADHDGYARWMRLIPIGQSEEPCSGWILNRIE